MTDKDKLEFRGVQEFNHKEILELFKSVSMESVNKSFLHFESEDNGEYCQLSAFKEGKGINFDKEELIKKLKAKSIVDLDELSYSLRITNVQKLIPQIRKVILYIYKKYGLASSCNMYFTPNKQNNCFLYHSDYQETLIYQMFGDKIWNFPVDEDDNYVRIPNFSSYGYTPDKTVEKKFTQGNIYSISHSLLHRAFLSSDSPAIHFTFAIEQKKTLDFVKAVVEEILTKDMESLLKTTFNEEDSKAQIKKFIKDISLIDLDEESKKFQDAADVKSIGLIKKGRRY